MKTCVARQPILDGRRDVFGYELLFRPGASNACITDDDDYASAKVLADALHLHGVEALCGGGKCFVNITPRIILDELYTALPREVTVLELLETVELDDALLIACAKCRDAGYSLALDDYVCEERFEPILPLIDVLKVDFMGTSAQQQASMASLAQTYGFRLLAEKVETYDEFTAARSYGYDYFQGYFFCKPEMVSTRDVPASKLAYMRFLQQLTLPELDLAELDTIVRQDVGLSYKLLRYLNSGAFRFRHEITSIRHALSLIGDRPLRTWSSLIVLSLLNQSKPTELLNTSMTRARLCENLADAAGMSQDKADLFMVGMFSVLDAMLDRDMASLLSDMSLTSQVKATLLGEPTAMRTLLDLAIALEQADWPQLTSLCDRLNVSETTVVSAQADAIAWAAQQSSHIAAAGSSPPGAGAESKAA